jgi:hypothetical protein
MKRVALLKHIGIGSVAALAGVVAVEDEADATIHPFNLDISSSPSLAPAIRPPKPGSPSAHIATTGTTIQVQHVQIITDPANLKVPAGWSSQVFEIANAYIKGTDENNTPHGTGGGYTPLGEPVYFVVSSPNKFTCQ